jgi:ATP-dependent Lon protease
MKLFGKTEERQEEPELESLRESLEAAHLPTQARETATRELDRLAKTHPSAPEYSIGLAYLEFLITLPWNKHSEDILDLNQAEAMLDRDHYGLSQVKERILEFLAVRIMRAKRKARLLVADDEEITRNNLKHILEKDGHAVTTVADGEEAISVLGRQEFDVVLADIKMGRVDGLQVLEHVKRDTPDTQVIMITAYATVDSAVNAMKKGAYHYLSKPFKLDDVRQTIRNVLNQKGRLGLVRGPVLCFVGPPGTGKTSLGRSIARALGRKFVHVSLAGLKDEAELRGHRRTYVGAMPGRILQEIARLGVNNPVFLLDEVDKAIQNLAGNPVSALLEVLDQEQNNAFNDYYLGLPFDLSSVLFIATANINDPIPPALLDRMELLAISGYAEAEKVQIALQYMIPEQIRNNGLEDMQVEFTREAIYKIVREYTSEAGLRNLEREIDRICRKIAREMLTRLDSAPKTITVTPERVEKLLGPRRRHREIAGDEDRVGVSTGLVWSENGGDIVFVEATIMPGQGNLILTGSLGDIMQESARAALSHIRANTSKFGLDEDPLSRRDIHIHVPAGAIPKDGPSAGVTIAVALLSLFTHRAVKRDVALTGEMTLSGRILPVGGVREKVLAARRAGIKTLVFPEQNRGDVKELPPEALEGLDVFFIHCLELAAELALN